MYDPPRLFTARFLIFFKVAVFAGLNFELLTTTTTDLVSKTIPMVQMEGEMIVKAFEVFGNYLSLLCKVNTIIS